jgi:hypothetical protein
MRRILLLPCMITFGLLQPNSVLATVITFTDREVFEAQANIALISNFDDVTSYGGFDLLHEGNTYSAPHVFTSNDLGISNVNTIGDVFGMCCLTIHPGAAYNMLGFDIAVWNRFNAPDSASFVVSTNLGRYYFYDQPIVSTSFITAATLDFFGFRATHPDEVILGVTVAPCVSLRQPPTYECLADSNSTELYGGPPFITNVTYAHAKASVPEPSTLALFLTALFWSGRKLKRKATDTQ